MWQDHLILCSKLIVEHAKAFTSRVQDTAGSTGSTAPGVYVLRFECVPVVSYSQSYQ
jgi:hypothetical protein